VKERRDPSSPTFQTGVNVVLVPVVARDRHGRAVGNLTERDFQILDHGKPQTISGFSMVEHESPITSRFAAIASGELEGAGAHIETSPAAPQSVDVKTPPGRFFIYYQLNRLPLAVVCYSPSVIHGAPIAKSRASNRSRRRYL
jgi:hypothetical protein